MDRTAYVASDEGLVAVASLIADGSRAQILLALLDGRALTAGELARAAGVAPQTASGHLARLAEGGLLACEAQGRRRYYRIVNAEVAHAIEALTAIARRRPEETIAHAIRHARTCYDHLAGRLGVGLADTLTARGVLVRRPREFDVTEDGVAWFTDFGVDVERACDSRRKFAPACLDWSERRHHIGGAMGAAMNARMFDLGWFARIDGTRALRITVAGRRAFERDLRITPSVSA
jgi:DNA-binding transcriptional ArsR family regulator